MDGQLTGTLADTLVGGPSGEDSGVRAPLHDPLAIVPCGEHVAVLWGKWSSFDGTKWSEPQPVASTLLEPPVRYFSMASVGKEILLSTDKGLVVWDGTSWKDDESLKGAFLTACGGKVVGFSVEDKGVGSALLFWQRSPNGAWASREIASEALPICFNVYRGYGARCVAVPKTSPPDFAPVAWTCKGQTWVKVLRVPIE